MSPERHRLSDGVIILQGNNGDPENIPHLTIVKHKLTAAGQEGSCLSFSRCPALPFPSRMLSQCQSAPGRALGPGCLCFNPGSTASGQVHTSVSPFVEWIIYFFKGLL